MPVRFRPLVPYTGPIAQWLEQWTHNPLVLGSSPSGPTIIIIINMTTLYLGSIISEEQLKYLDDDKLFSDFTNKYYLYRLDVKYYERQDLDVIINDSHGSKIPINIKDLPDFVTAFSSIVEANALCSFTAYKLINKKDC